MFFDLKPSWNSFFTCIVFQTFRTSRHCTAAPAHTGGGTRPINKRWLQRKGHFISEPPAAAAARARGPQAFWFLNQSASFHLRRKLQMAAASCPENGKRKSTGRPWRNAICLFGRWKTYIDYRFVHLNWRCSCTNGDMSGNINNWRLAECWKKVLK